MHATENSAEEKSNFSCASCKRAHRYVQTCSPNILENVADNYLHVRTVQVNGNNAFMRPLSKAQNVHRPDPIRLRSRTLQMSHKNISVVQSQMHELLTL
jgi:hypothetical protein